MKFHINNDYEVLQCNATKQACEFSGEAHFENKEEAESRQAFLLEERYGITSSNRNEPESITKLRSAGISINMLSHLGSSPVPTESSVVLIDERPTAEFLDEVLSGQLKP